MYAIGSIIVQVMISGSSSIMVNGQLFRPQCEIFTAKKTIAPYVSTTTWDLPKSANANFSEYGALRVMSFSGYNENKSFCDATTGDPIFEFIPTKIGELPHMADHDAAAIVEEAAAAYNGGANYWTSGTTLPQRIQMIRRVLEDFNNNREQFIRILMWEIGKNYDDAAEELDSTLEFFDHVVLTALNDPQYHNKGQWQDIPSSSGATTTALTKRTALGVVMISTYQYPVSDVYRLLLPALLMGNVCILKIPIIGGLVHIFTQHILAAHLPVGSIYIVSGPGPMVVPAMLQTGKIDAVAIHGTGNYHIDELLKHHPYPHKLKTFAHMDTRNIAVVLPELFDPVNKDTYYEHAMKESIASSFKYSGQLSTALKVYFVPKLYADRFVLDFAERVEKISIGLPWQTHTVTTTDVTGATTTRQEYSQITPLPNFARVSYLQTRIDDALRKGARMINENGGREIGTKSALLRPSVIYPLNKNMSFYREESIGPVVLMYPYDDIDEVYDYLYHNHMSHQLSIFGRNVTSISRLIDKFSAVVGRININSQSSASPDVLPLVVRRNSGMGVMSVTDVLNEFSVPTVLSHKNQDMHDEILDELAESSVFLGNAKETQ